MAINPPRDNAKLLSERFFKGTACFCGCTDFYTVNGACVDCTKARSIERYSTPEGRKKMRAGDKARYLRKKQS